MESSHEAQQPGHQAALRTEQGDAQIADRDFHGEQWGGDQRAEQFGAGCAEIDHPGEQEAEHDFERDGDGDIDDGDDDAVPELVGLQHAGIICEADIAGDAAAQHVVGKAVADHLGQREEREADDPDDRRCQHQVFERDLIVEAPALAAARGCAGHCVARCQSQVVHNVIQPHRIMGGPCSGHPRTRVPAQMAGSNPAMTRRRRRRHPGTKSQSFRGAASHAPNDATYSAFC